MFYLGLTILAISHLGVSFFIARKHPLKRQFASSFFFTLITFYIAVDPQYNKNNLLLLLIALTAHNIYIILKKQKDDK